MRNSTLLFLVKKENQETKHICLAMKKRGFGAGRFNGVGGKVEGEETIEAAAIREAEEEIGIKANILQKCAELSFTFPHNPAFDQLVHVYFTESWDGDPKESEEMAPSWFEVSDIPFKDMWPDDKFWVPHVLRGDFVQGRFVFGEGDVILEQEISLQ